MKFTAVGFTRFTPNVARRLLSEPTVELCHQVQQLAMVVADWLRHWATVSLGHGQRSEQYHSIPGATRLYTGNCIFMGTQCVLYYIGLHVSIYISVHSFKCWLTYTNAEQRVANLARHRLNVLWQYNIGVNFWQLWQNK